MKKLLAVRCLLLAVRCSLLAVRCLLLAVSCPLLAVSCSLFAICAHASALVLLSTTTEFTSTAIARFRAYHGETVRLTHRLTLAGAPLDLSGASARFYWRTEEMEDWWSTDATLEADSVWCDFTPEMDPGTEAIWYFFGITQANAIAYRANGSLTLLDSPGFTPADLGEPDALAAALEALFKEADTRYATKEALSALAREQTAHSEQLTANSQQLTALEAALEGKADAFTVGEGLTLEAGVLSADTPSTFTEPVKIQNGMGTGSLWIGGDTNAGTLTNNQRHLARIVVPTFSDVTKGTTLLGFDSSGDGDMSVANKDYDAVSFGGMKKITNATSPMAIGFCVTKTRGAMSANEKVYPMEMDANEVRFNVQPNVNGNTLATTAEVNAAVATVPKITVDSTLSSTSKNPVQNKVLYSALNNKADKTALDKKADKNHSHSQYVSAESSAIATDLGEGFELDASRALITSYDAILGVTEINGVGYIAWRGIYDGLVHRFALGGGGNTEVWKGNVGFGEQDTFFGPRRVAEGEGQFYKGYPRLHNHGQDIHEVSGFSRDSRDDETVWSHRLLLPWDLAKANDTSYLMAAVQWESTRLAGVNCKFVQPLLPTNTPEATSALGLPYALPCFENSPIYWNGHLIYGEGNDVKQVQIPWGRISNGETAKVPIIHGDKSQLSIEDDEGRTLVIYEDGRGGYVHTKGMTTSPTGFSFVTQALLDRISALESGGGSSPTPTLEVATWSGTVCSVPWGANPLLIDCSGQTEYDFTIQFPVADWPEGAARLLFIRATPTPTVGDGIIDSLKGGNGLLTPSVVGYDYLEQGEEYTVSAWRRGSRLRLMVVDRERLSDL